MQPTLVECWAVQVSTKDKSCTFSDVSQLHGTVWEGCHKLEEQHWENARQRGKR